MERQLENRLSINNENLSKIAILGNYSKIAEELGFKNNYQETSGIRYGIKGQNMENVKHSPSLALVLPIMLCYPCK